MKGKNDEYGIPANIAGCGSDTRDRSYLYCFNRSVSPYSSSPTLQLLSLSVVFMAMTFIIFILYGLSANGVRRYVVNSPRIITRLRRLFAGIFAALGIKLALIDQ